MTKTDRESAIGATPEVPQQFKGVVHFYSETGTEGGYWSFQDERFITTNESGEARWSYEGLHILKDGDNLTIYSKENPEEVAWEGEISLQLHPLFTEHAQGMWIHSDQRGIDREAWADYFFHDYPAKLTPATEPQK